MLFGLAAGLAAFPAVAEVTPPAAEAPAAPAPVTSAPHAELTGLLRLDELFAIMQKEGEAYGEELQEDLFAGQGGTRWRAEVREIYDAGRLLPLFLSTFEAALTDVDTAPMQEFFATPFGRRAIDLELAARRALLDDGVEEAATLRLEDMMAAEAPRLAQIERFAAAGDLIEANVLGGLNANLAFYRGMVEGGAIPGDPTDADLLADVWSQEDSIRAETERWLYSYLLLAYDPLTDEELDGYIAFTDSPAGQQLNAALFVAFDRVFEQVSRDLGRAAAQILAGQEI